jgi:hypothetical protein
MHKTLDCAFVLNKISTASLQLFPLKLTFEVSFQI